MLTHSSFAFRLCKLPAALLALALLNSCSGGSMPQPRDPSGGRGSAAGAGGGVGGTRGGGEGGSGGRAAGGGGGAAGGSGAGGSDGTTLAADGGTRPDAAPVGADAAAGSGGVWKPPQGPFPLEKVLAAKPEVYLPGGVGRTEGIASQGGDLFFCGDKVGVARLDADKRLYTYYGNRDCGALFDAGDGTLLLAHGKSGLAQIFKDGKVGILADLPGDKGFANDLTVDAEGNVYFTNSGTGDIVRATPDGMVAVVAKWTGANGIEVDPANKFLYVTGTAGIARFPLRGEGGLPGPVEMVDNTVKSPDGCTFDAWGNIWVAGFTGELVIIDGQRKILGRWSGLGGDFSNLTFAGPKEDVVFATNGQSLRRFEVGVPGFRGHKAAPRYKVLRYQPTTVTNTPL